MTSAPTNKPKTEPTPSNNPEKSCAHSTKHGCTNMIALDGQQCAYCAFGYCGYGTPPRSEK